MAGEKKSPPSVTRKQFAQGHVLLKGGSKTANVYLVQSGRFIVNVSRDGINELHQSEAPQCLGEEVLFGAPTVAFTPLAVESSEVIEVPVEFAKAQFSKADPTLMLVLKGLAERMRIVSTELKTVKLSRGSLPCPPDLTANIFGVVYHAALYVGKKNESIVEANWDEFQDYAVGAMESSPYRIRQALNILVKLGYAELHIEDKGMVIFKDMFQIEAFFDFYQNYYFKSAYASLLKTDDKITTITKTVLKIADKYPPDRAGVVRMPFKATIDALKEVLGNTFEADQLFRLEQKGLMIKRIATQDGGILSFYRPEFEQMLLNWKVLREVELWNENGYVDMSGYVSPQEQAARVAEAQSIADRLEAWQPPALRGEVLTIRLEPPKPGELLCATCMCTITKNQLICEVCDSDLATNGSKAA